MKDKFEAIVLNSVIFGQYFFLFWAALLSAPAHLFFLLLAASATLADRLARKRYGIKEEGRDYFSMSSREIPSAVFGIKDPVLASHQAFPEQADRNERLVTHAPEKVEAQDFEDSSFSSSEEDEFDHLEEPHSGSRES